jgi:hypothetical protein
MNDICCLLDACTVINLIHIDDEDDFILKKLKENLDIRLNEIVFKEIQQNVYARLEISEIYKNAHKKELLKKKKNIEQKLTFFRGKSNNNSDLEKDLGNDFFERIQTLTKYNKKPNGELYSVAHALYMSRVEGKKVFFYTDDLPAKDFFTSFFNFQQIGHIKDSVDLIILLYWIDEKFTHIELQRLLSDLYSQYATDVNSLKKILQDFRQNKLDAMFLKKNRDVSENLLKLIKNLENHDFKNIIKIK